MMKKHELLEYFTQVVEGKKDVPAHRRLGAEYEQFVLLPQASALRPFQPLPIEGSQSVRRVLQYFAEETQTNWQWKKDFDEDHLIGLSNERGQSVTIEPGGQVEFSGAPLASLAEMEAELKSYLQDLEASIQPFGGKLFSIGVNPLFTLAEMPFFSKQRYRIMYPYMAQVGTHGQYMMKLTASAQVSVDYFSIEDLQRKFVYLNRLSPFLTAIFANSPLLHGEESGFKSYRARIWWDTDSARAGLPQAFTHEKFQVMDYVDWAIQAPPYGFKRQGKIVQTTSTRFADLMADVRPEFPVTWGDWKQHLGMLFPDVRLKNILEVRCIDALPAPYFLAVPALIKALIYHPAAMQKVYDWAMSLPWEDFPLYRQAAARDGLAAEVNGMRFGQAAHFLLEEALNALGSPEEHYLLPYFEHYTKHGFSPADLVLKQFKEAQGDLSHWLAAYWAESANSSLL